MASTVEISSDSTTEDITRIREYNHESSKRMKQLYTRWGRQIDTDHVLPEYPRPLLQRSSYVSLNGYWDYAITKSFKKPISFDGEILVPFSPESALSGVGRQLKPTEYLWYRRRLVVESDQLQAGFRLLLHFGAVDQACRIYVNGKEAARHAGGYLPFSVDITQYCTAGDDAELLLAVRDLCDTSYHARGKQKLKRGGMFYTAQSGIWQTVWMEYVPASYVEEIMADPDLNHGSVRITVCSAADLPLTIRVTEPGLYQEAEPTEHVSTVPSQEQSVPAAHPTSAAEYVRKDNVRNISLQNYPASQTTGFQDHGEKKHTDNRKTITEASGQSNHPIDITLPVVRPWTCDEPYLYRFTVKMGEDIVESYFALRTFTIAPDADGIPRICLNGQVQFQNGVLDQGYWPDGLYTAPADEAYVFDILEMKKMGFNMLRKHVKIEPQRWYYHCDRLGMVVWQDMVNGGSYYKHWFVTYAATLISRKRLRIPDTCLRLLSRTHREGQLEFVREMKETIRLLKGHPSIAAWVIFNEGWGQFHARRITQIARECDRTRLIDQASGWFDQNGGDLQSIHHYFFTLKFAPEKSRATVLSEFGGYSLRVPKHSACKKLYGYKTFTDTATLRKAYDERMKKVQDQIPEGMCASVYTQLSDVEEEVNGILTYDREINKLSL